MAAKPLAVTLTSGWMGWVNKHWLSVTVALAALGLAIIGVGLSRSLWPALLFLALAGAADCVSRLLWCDVCCWRKIAGLSRNRTPSCSTFAEKRRSVDKVSLATSLQCDYDSRRIKSK